MTPPGDRPFLSILIATLAHRQDRFAGLLDVLLPQAEASPVPVEVVALRNSGEKTLAAYRQDMLDDARGRYLCCIDDDDMVPSYYVSEIVAAFTDPAVDVLGFEMECTGLAARRAFFSLANHGAPWGPVQRGGETVYLRDFNHLSPVRAEIARTGKYAGGDASAAEDVIYTRSVWPALESATEKVIGRVMYHYRFSPHDTNQAGGVWTPLRDRIRATSPEPRPDVTSSRFRWHEGSTVD